MNILHGYLLKAVVLLGLVVGGVVLPVSDCWGQGILGFGTAPRLGALKDPGVLCEGALLKVEAPDGSGKVDMAQGTGWMIGNRTIPELYHVLASDHGQELKFWIENSCGSDTARLALRVNTGIKVNLSGTGTICSGETTTLTLEISGGTPPYGYSFNGKAYTEQTAGRPFTENPAATTSYSVTNFSDAIGCSPFMVNGGAITAPLGTVFAGEQFTIASGTAASASKGEVTYSWTVNGSPVDGTGETLNHTASAAGLYAFVRTATSVLDVTKSAPATVSVTVIACPPTIPAGGNEWTETDDCTNCTWQQAKDKCVSLGMQLPNDDDWGALPKKSNVLGLTDASGYWSATERSSDNASIWNWDSFNGNLYGPHDFIKAIQNKVRCVKVKG